MPTLVDRIATVLFDQERDHGNTGASRTETRYLIGYPNKQEPVLVSWASMQNMYRVHTIYLDTPAGTWSRGKSQTKIRLRNYNGEMTWWIEVKSTTDGTSVKHRRTLYPEDIRKLNGLVPIAGVTYRRSEFESPRTSPDLRVTMDSDVLVWELPKVPVRDVLYAQGRPIAKLDAMILETKGPAVFPAWLPLPKIWTGCKSRYSLAALAGHPESIAPSITNASLAGVPV